MEEEPKKESEEDSKEDQEEHLELEEHQANQGFKDMESGVSQGSFDSDKEPGDEFEFDYDPFG